MNHTLKCDTIPFQAIIDNLKKFEFRKNDRGFELGDQLTLIEIDSKFNRTGRACIVDIIYMLDKGYGIPEGYCVMSILKIKEYKYDF